MDCDVIIIGGGHAGVEAADAVARMGATAALVSMDKNKLALMSCNPAIGGIGKSHLVKEIDALGGLMAKAIDTTGIQFRRLNLSRGPAVWSTRVQADRIKYNEYVVDYINSRDRIDVIEGLAGKIVVDQNKVAGIITESGQHIGSKAVIVCTGTFLGGLIHIGETQIKAGRFGENAAYKLSESYFSPYSDRKPFTQSACYLTYTTDATKRLISANFKKSPIFSGTISSTGPRYCPSIEDKFHRFADKEKHQIFLEPEGNGTSEIYPNGFSTALPEDIQRKAIRTIIGLEEVVITRPGYAVEYDYCPAYQIKPSLETRRVGGLYFAGQINGTSGYEEAAAQGLMAGVNAVLGIRKEPPFVVDRSEAYIGVMIDDLTTRSTTEPYRLFTSRAEYRLALREDNARDRLNEYALKYDLINSGLGDAFIKLQNETETAVTASRKIRLSLASLGDLKLKYKTKESISLEEYLKQPGITIQDALAVMNELDELVSDNQEVLERMVINVRYKGYIEKQQREIDKFKRLEKEVIPESFEYATINGLKTEAKEKFKRFKPSSLGQAGRIEGITPGDIAVLSVYLKRFKGNRANV